MNDDLAAGLNNTLRRRVALLSIDVPSTAVIATRARLRQRTHRRVVGGLIALVLVATVSVFHSDGPSRVTTTADAPDGGSGLPAVLPAIPQVVLDGWNATYFIALPEGYVEYQWQREQVRLQVSFYAAGDYAGRAKGDPRGDVTVRGATGSLLDYGNGRYRVDWVERGRTWEADGGPFADKAAFLAVVGALHGAASAEWLATLPAGTVLPDQLDTAIDDVLRGVPIPDGFDVTALRASVVPASKYNLIARVLGSLTCAWIDQATSQAGTPAGQRARDALATARGWPALAEIEGQGGYASVLWDTAARVANGDAAAAANAPQALGCSS
jgi:hypothetical protein